VLASAIANGLRGSGLEFTDWEADFLEDIGTFRGPQLSYRQVEKLLQIRDDYEQIKQFRGLLAQTLIQRCYEARADLPSEADEEFIESYRGKDTIRRKHVGRLMRCAASLGFVEDYMWSGTPPQEFDVQAERSAEQANGRGMFGTP